MTEDGLDKIDLVRDMYKNLGQVTLGEMLETLTDKIIEENIVAILETGIALEKGHSEETSNESRNRSMCSGRSRSGSRARTNRDRIQCYKCREYNHFARDCPTSKEERKIQPLQQMLNLGDEQTLPKSTMTNTQDSFSQCSSEEYLGAGHLNL